MGIKSCLRAGLRNNLRGGMMHTLPTSQVISFVLLLLVVHVVLASLMWTNTVTFASTEERNLVASAITIVAFFLVVYLLYVSTSS
jgi:hypothetical protein